MATNEMSAELKVYVRGVMEIVPWQAIVTLAAFVDMMPTELLEMSWQNGATAEEFEQDVEKMYKTFH